LPGVGGVLALAVAVVLVVVLVYRQRRRTSAATQQGSTRRARFLFGIVLAIVVGAVVVDRLIWQH
jgi:multisubunit Na+/H+ antiporter MnhB subunit